MDIIKLTDIVGLGQVQWVLGLGKSLFPDEALELAFYNNVSGDANNQTHTHHLSTERLLIIQGGMSIEIKGQLILIGAMEMICIPPGSEHRIISYQEGTIALNLRNSTIGAVGHLHNDRS